MTTQIQTKELICVPSTVLKDALVGHVVAEKIIDRAVINAKKEVIRDFVPTVRNGFISQLNDLVENGLNGEKEIAVKIDGANISLKEFILTETFGVVKSTLADQFGPAGYKVSFESLGNKQYKFVLHPDFELSDIPALAEEHVKTACETKCPDLGQLLVRAMMTVQ